MKKAFHLLALPLIILALSPGLSLAKEAEVTLKVHHFLPAASNAQTKLIQPWADRLKADSGGRIAVEIYPSMQLGGKPPQLYDQVRDGVVDVVWTLPGYTPGRFPITQIIEAPFVFENAQQGTEVGGFALGDPQPVQAVPMVAVQVPKVVAGAEAEMLQGLAYRGGAGAPER